MKPPPFQLERAADVEAVLALLSQYGDDAKIIAGGQSLVPLLNLRMVRPAVLVDINGIDALGGVTEGETTVRLGAQVRHADVLRSRVVSERVPVLSEAISHVGHAQIRNRGTLGGSAAHADPAAELPACLTALEARFLLRSSRGERMVNSKEFFVGPFTTALENDEVLMAVEVAVPPESAGQVFVEFARRRGDFALAGVAAIVELDVDGRCLLSRLALLAAGGAPVRVHSAEALLIGERIDEATAGAAATQAAADIDPPSDVHGSSEFRRRVSRELVRRALLTAAGRAAPAMN